MKLNSISLLTILFICAASMSANKAHAEMSIGVNVVNPMTRGADYRQATLNQLKTSGVRVIRARIGNGSTDIAFMKALYDNGIRVILLPDFRYAPDATERPYDMQRRPSMFGGPLLSEADPVASGRYYASILRALDQQGVKLEAIELGNEINWAAFNRDFPVPGHNRTLTYHSLINDPEGKQIAKSYIRYLEVLKALKAARDASTLNKDTPIILSGLITQTPPRDLEGDWVDVKSTLRFMRENGLDSLVDAYGLHMYPNTQEDPRAFLAPLLKICGVTKPCWVTEWGLPSDDTQCPGDDHDRAALAQDYMDVFRFYYTSGKLLGETYFAWDANAADPREDKYAAYHCDKLTATGRAVLKSE